jgi:hypothetical protein
MQLTFADIPNLFAAGWPILFAADWIQLILVIVFVLYSIGHAIMNMMNQAPKPKQPRPQGQMGQQGRFGPQGQMRQQGQMGPQGQPAKPKTLEDKLRQEVEQFLRQVQGEEPKPTPPKKPVVVAQKPAATRLEPQRQPRRESVQAHVSQHINTAEVTQHLSELGLEVSHADEKMTAHVQEKFQHQLGAFQSSQQPTETRRQRNDAAAEIAKLLRSPQGMRQVIVASEILRRPDS